MQSHVLGNRLHCGIVAESSQTGGGGHMTPINPAHALSRRSFLKGAGAATAGARSARAAAGLRRLLGVQGQGPAGSKGNDVLTIGLPVAAADYKHAASLLTKFTKQPGSPSTRSPRTRRPTAGWRCSRRSPRDWRVESPSTRPTSRRRGCSCSSSRAWSRRLTPHRQGQAGDRQVLRRHQPPAAQELPQPRQSQGTHLLPADRLQRDVDLVQPDSLPACKVPEPAPHGRGTTSCRRRPRSRRPPTGSASPSARRHPGRSPTSIRGRSPTAPRS